MKLDKETSSVQQIKEQKPIIKIPETFLANLDDYNNKIVDGGETTNFEELQTLTWQAKDGKIGSNVTFKGNITIKEEQSTIKDNEVIEE